MRRSFERARCPDTENEKRVYDLSENIRAAKIVSPISVIVHSSMWTVEQDLVWSSLQLCELVERISIHIHKP